MANLSELRQQLQSGGYRPRPVYAREIPKPRGGKRLIGAPAVEDRIVERALMEVVDEHVDAVLRPWSYAYRRGLSRKDALHDLAQERDDGARWVVRADIEDCFERIPHWPVMERFRATVPDERAAHFVGLLVNRHGVGPAAKRIKSGRGLHQGGPMSPVLTNLYLDTFDPAMLRDGFRVLRYSDDFAIPVATQKEGERGLERAAALLRDLELDRLIRLEGVVGPPTRRGPRLRAGSRA